MANTGSKNIVNYIVILFVILWSGGLAVFGSFEMWPYVLLPVALIVFINRDGVLSRYDYWFLAICLLVSIIHWLRYGGTVFIAIRPFLALMVPYLFAKVVYKDFVDIYVKVMCFFAVISLVFWCLDFVPEIHDAMLNLAKRLPQGSGMSVFWDEWDAQYNYSLFFYEMRDTSVIENSYRNSGPFFEPGRYVIFLGIAYILNYYRNGNKYLDGTNIILLLTIITTFSTTGYVAMIFFFLANSAVNTKYNTISKIILFTLFLIGAYYVSQLDFMAGKIVEQIDESSYQTNNRFGALIYHWGYIVQSPIFGFGNQLGNAVPDFSRSPNGVSGLLLYWGIPIALIMFVKLYKCFGVLTTLQRRSWSLIVPFFFVMLLVFSQTITANPFFYFLYGIGSVKVSDMV